MTGTQRLPSKVEPSSVHYFDDMQTNLLWLRFYMQCSDADRVLPFTVKIQQGGRPAKLWQGEGRFDDHCNQLRAARVLLVSALTTGRQAGILM